MRKIWLSFTGGGRLVHTIEPRQDRHGFWKSWTSGELMGIQANQLLGRDLEPGECVGPLFVCDGEDLAIHGTKTTVNAALESEGIDVKPTVDRILNSVHRKLSDSWIPVEERLPEERGCWYQVTRIIGTERWVTDSYWSGDFWQHEDVIAWKPLPEAYQPPN